MLRGFLVVDRTCCMVVVVVMVRVRVGLTICIRTTFVPGLLIKVYVQQGALSSPVWTSTALLTTALIKFGIRLPLRRGPLS